jgi:hypothetical protein
VQSCTTVPAFALPYLTFQAIDHFIHKKRRRGEQADRDKVGRTDATGAEQAPRPWQEQRCNLYCRRAKERDVESAVARAANSIEESCAFRATAQGVQ